MLLRNTANQPIVFQPLLALDGTPQTSGAAVAVRKDGVDVTSPAGTLSHWGDGVWQYIPTAGETDAGIVALKLSKVGSVAVPLNFVTTRLPNQTAGVLPAAAAGSSGGLPTQDAVGVALNADYAKKSELLQPEDVTTALSAAAVGVKAGGITTESFAANATIPRVTLADTVTTYTGNTPQTGDLYARVNPLVAGGAFTQAALAQAPAGTVDPSAIVAAINAAGVKLRADGLDAIVIEAGVNARQAICIQTAALGGIVSGAGTGLISIKGANSNVVRINSTTDASGNRPTVQLVVPN